VEEFVSPFWLVAEESFEHWGIAKDRIEPWLHDATFAQIKAPRRLH